MSKANTNKMMIQDLVRLSSVKRWHIVRTATQQSVAEHSFNVILLSIEMDIRTEYSMVPEDRLDLIELAMTHDMEEVYTGDIPSPQKGPREWSSKLSAQSIVAVADLMEAYIFIKENKIGSHALKVFNSMKKEWELMLSEVHPELSKAAHSMYMEITYGDTYEQRRSEILETDTDAH